MDARQKLLSELRTVCTDTGVDFEKVNIELSDLFGSDEIVDYYIAKGPLPSFPEALFDVIVLGNKALYDYDMRKKGVLVHFQPLSKIAEIGEEFTGNEYLAIHFKIGELGGGLVLQDKLSESKNMRKFARAVSNKVV